MSIEILPLSRIPLPIAMRDQYAGPNANILIPGIGYWYADGKQLDFSSATVPQNRSQFLGANAKPGVFYKSAGVCITQRP